MKYFFATLLSLALILPARAMVGGATPADPAIARHVVLIVGSRGTACTGVVIARDVILTVAHCAAPDATYKWVSFDNGGQPTLNDIATVTRRPQFDLKAFLNHRAAADVALMKTAQPLPANFSAAPMTPPRDAVAVGQKFLVAGYGLLCLAMAGAAAKRAPRSLPLPVSPARCRSVFFRSAHQQRGAWPRACTGDPARRCSTYQARLI